MSRHKYATWWLVKPSAVGRARQCSSAYLHHQTLDLRVSERASHGVHQAPKVVCAVLHRLAGQFQCAAPRIPDVLLKHSSSAQPGQSVSWSSLLRCAFSGPTKRARILRTSNTKNTLRAWYSGQQLVTSGWSCVGSGRSSKAPCLSSFLPVTTFLSSTRLGCLQLCNTRSSRTEVTGMPAEFIMQSVIAINTHHVLGKLFSSCAQHFRSCAQRRSMAARAHHRALDPSSASSTPQSLPLYGRGLCLSRHTAVLQSLLAIILMPLWQ